jgi:hypothetical protein
MALPATIVALRLIPNFSVRNTDDEWRRRGNERANFQSRIADIK